MNRIELADLPEPKYLLYPNLYIYRGLMGLPVIAFLAFSWWFIPELVQGKANIWHWVMFGFLGVMTVGVFLPKSRDWRRMINFAATPEGAWFVTGLEAPCVFVPWKQVKEVQTGSVQGSGKTIQGVIFRVDVDRETWEQLSHPNLLFPDGQPDEQGLREIGISANLRKPSSVVEQIQRFRRMER